MEKVKQDVENIISTITNDLPDDFDLKGLPGISKAVMLSALQETDTLLTNLKEYETQIEVIFLKREISDLCSQLKNEFSEPFDKIKKHAFISIIRKITKIKLLTKETYFSATNHPIRTEIEIGKAKEDLGQLLAVIEQIKAVGVEVNTSKTSFLQNVTAVEGEIKTQKETLTQDFTRQKDEVNANKEGAVKKMSELQTEIIGIKEKSVSVISGFQTELSTLKDATAASLNGYQSEIQIQKDTILKNLNALSTETNALKGNITQVHTEVIALKDASSGIVNDFSAKQKTATDSEIKIIDFLTKVETLKTSIEAIDKNTVLWEQEIKKAKDDIAERTKEYEELTSRSKSLQSDIASAHELILGKKEQDVIVTKGYLQNFEDLKAQIGVFLTEQEGKYKAQFSQIESLLPGATTAGLAEAFQKQKESYRWPIIIWSGIFFLVTFAMTAFSIYLFYLQFIKPAGTHDNTITEGILTLLKDLPFFIPTIWLAVFASKQQSQYKRLQQEYAFKEINAKSFYGHKKQIEELMNNGVTDKDLLLKLVAQLVVITSQNPSETLDNKSHNDSPPIFKLVEKFFPAKAKNNDPVNSN